MRTSPISKRETPDLGAPLLRMLMAAALTIAAGGCRPAGDSTSGDPASRDPLLVPNAKFEMQTPEFDVDITTNAMGFRGAPAPAPTPGRIRIVALGDAFTFGYGVQASEAWPARLEARLRAKGVDAEVLNLGVPGTGPHDYALIAERALPSLQPQLVIVGLVQGDDFVEAGNPGPVSMLGPMQEPARKRAESAFASLTDDERGRLAAIDPKARTLFESGGVDPSLVTAALRRPGYFLEPVEKSAADLELHSTGMREALSRLKEVADRVGARTLAVGVPHPFYVSASAQKNLGRLGFRVDPAAIRSRQSNRLMRDAVIAAGFDDERIRGPVTAFRRFEGRPRTPRYFFYWDGRLNAAGHEEFAGQIVKVVRHQVGLVLKK